MPIGTGNKAIAGLGSHHIAIQTTDYEASVDFYTEVMGMTEVVGFLSQGRRAVILDIGDGSHMELFEPIPGTQPSNDATGNIVFHFALQTTDIDTALERVRAAGMEITVEKTTVQMGPLNITLAFFKGPSGEVVEYIQVNE